MSIADAGFLWVFFGQIQFNQFLDFHVINMTYGSIVCQYIATLVSGHSIFLVAFINTNLNTHCSRQHMINTMNACYEVA